MYDHKGISILYTRLESLVLFVQPLNTKYIPNFFNQNLLHRRTSDLHLSNELSNLKLNKDNCMYLSIYCYHSYLVYSQCPAHPYPITVHNPQTPISLSLLPPPLHVSKSLSLSFILYLSLSFQTYQTRQLLHIYSRIHQIFIKIFQNIKTKIT